MTTATKVFVNKTKKMDTMEKHGQHIYAHTSIQTKCICIIYLYCSCVFNDNEMMLEIRKKKRGRDWNS